MRPRFLICNDDGIDAPGIHALVDALQEVGDLVVVAPASNYSSTGASSTISKEIHAERVFWEKGIEAWKVFGTPVDCVKVGLSQFCPTPDLLISGINNGGNHGKNVFYSGTIATTIHACFHGIPGIAFSHMGESDGEEHPEYALAKPHIPRIVRHFLQYRIPEHTVISINFPYRKEGDYRGIKWAKQGGSYWKQSVETLSYENGRHIFKHAATWIYNEHFEDSDTLLLEQGYITITPIRVHHLTDEVLYEQHAGTHLTDIERLSGDFPSLPDTQESHKSF